MRGTRTTAANRPGARALRRWLGGPPLRVRAGADDLRSANQRFLLYGVLPLWFVPAVPDWAMHRRSRIEDTSGTRESLIHARSRVLADGGADARDRLQITGVGGASRGTRTTGAGAEALSDS